MTKIISFCGRAQSGKTSSANFLTGLFLKQKGIINCFDIDDSGNLVVPTVYTDGKTGFGILDLNRKDYEFVDFMASQIWPTVKLYNIADNLKRTIMEIFNVPYENLYGTNEQKNQLTSIKRSAFSPFINKKILKDKGEFMTGRDLMQYFGTEICRKIDEDCWIRSCLRDIEYEQPEYALIADVRFENELDYISASKIESHNFKLTLNPLNSDHESEISVDAIPESKFTAIVDNANISIVAKNDLIQRSLFEKGIIKEILNASS